MSHKPKNVALLISGGGSTASAIIQACYANGPLHGYVEPAVVIASNENVAGIEKIKRLPRMNNRVVVIDRRAHGSPESFGEAILTECRRRHVDILGQYGWMEKTPPNVVAAFRERSVNQHPAPLDPGYADFGGAGVHGLRAHFMVLHIAKKTGRMTHTEATAHYIEDEFDKGAVIGRTGIDLLPNDTPESLAARLLPVEHALQIEVLLQFATGRIRTINRMMRLIQKGDERYLEEGMRLAREKYPYHR